MQSGTCIFCKKNISCNNYILNSIHNAIKSHLFCFLTGIHDASCNKILILTVGKHRYVNFCGKSHSLSCNSGIHNRLAILTYSNSSVFFEFFKVCNIFSILSGCYCSNRKYINICNFFCLINYISYHLNAVNSRLSIRHGTNRCKSTSCSCSRTCTDCLFMLKTRLPEMDM